MLRTPNAGRNSNFQRFLCKKAKKKQETNLRNISFLQSFAANFYFNQRLECAAPKHWSKYTTLYWSQVKWREALFFGVLGYAELILE